MAGITAHDPQEGRSVTTTFASHAIRVYELLEEHALLEEYGGETKLVFRGKVTEIFTLAKISQSYYTRIFRSLVSLECIVLAQRGAKNVDTVYVLYRKPEETEFGALRKSGLTEQRGSATVGFERRVKNLEINIGGINIAKALENLENRIKKLEGDSG